MKHNQFFVRRVVPKTPVDVKHSMLSVEPFERNGKILSRSVYIMDIAAERNKDIKPSSFALENLIASGADLDDITMIASVSQSLRALDSLSIFRENQINELSKSE